MYLIGNVNPFVSCSLEMCASIISMDGEMMSKAFKALGDPTRLHIVQLLSTCGSSPGVRSDGSVEGPSAGEICCHITGAEKITSTISHHLHELENAGLVHLERRGKLTLCTLDSEKLIALSTALSRIASGTAQKCCP